MKAITGRPVKFASVGEKLDRLEVFHPDRMASRILGMGDVLTLIEKAEQAVERDEQEEMEQRLLRGEFTFDDFLATRMIKKMGPLQGVLKLVPGMGRQLEGLDVDDAQMARVEAIVLSMTPHERRTPHLINGPRRRRIAAGSGTTIADVNRLLQARKQMEKMMKAMGKGRCPRCRPSSPAAPAAPAAGAGAGGRPGGFRHNPPQPRKAPNMAVRMRLTRVGSKTRSIASLWPTRARPATAASSRSSGATTRRPTRRRSTWTPTRSRAGSPGRPAVRSRRSSDQGRRDRVGALEELLAWIARGLVDDPDSVRVERIEDDAVVLRLHVADDDVGKVIGRQGRVARALRTVVRSASARADRRIVLEIAD